MVFDLMATYLIAAGATRAVLVVQVLWLLALGRGHGDRAGPLGAGRRRLGARGDRRGHRAAGLPGRGTVRGASPGKILKNLAVPLVAVAPAMFAGYGVSRLFDLRVLALLTGGLCATMVYVGILFVWTRRLLRTLRTVMDVEHDEQRQLGEPKLAAPA